MEPSHSDTKGIGDLRVVGRWQGLSAPGSVTGHRGWAGAPDRAVPPDSSMPGRKKASEVDRGLQPGTGTVQAVLGAYHLGAISPELGYFVQATGQAPLTERDGYKPGSFVQASAALNYTHWRNITPQLQLSFRKTWRDSGPNSDRPNSGGEQVNLAPGLSAKLGTKVVGFSLRRAAALRSRERLSAGAEGEVLSGPAVPPLAACEERRDDPLQRRHVDRRPPVSLGREDEAAGAVVDARDRKRRRECRAGASSRHRCAPRGTRTGS